MDSETEAKIESAVREILGESDMNVMTEYKVRKLASERLELDLSKPSYKAIVRRIVQSFLEEQKEKEVEEEEEQKEKVEEEEEEQKEEEEEEEEEEEDKGKSGGAKEYDDDGDLIVCRLSEKRKVTIQDFKGRSLVSIREFYKKDGKELPTSKGISLTEEQWSTFKKNVPAIEKAISKMESRFG